jgi:hypothetical protein
MPLPLGFPLTVTKNFPPGQAVPNPLVLPGSNRFQAGNPFRFFPGTLSVPQLPAVVPVPQLPAVPVPSIPAAPTVPVLQPRPQLPPAPRQTSLVYPGPSTGPSVGVALPVAGPASRPALTPPELTAGPFFSGGRGSGPPALGLPAGTGMPSSAPPLIPGAPQPPGFQGAGPTIPPDQLARMNQSAAVRAAGRSFIQDLNTIRRSGAGFVIAKALIQILVQEIPGLKQAPRLRGTASLNRLAAGTQRQEHDPVAQNPPPDPAVMLPSVNSGQSRSVYVSLPK